MIPPKKNGRTLHLVWVFPDQKIYPYSEMDGNHTWLWWALMTFAGYVPTEKAK